MPNKKRVLLIGWDAADWKVINPLLDNGEMPYLAKLIEQGVMGNLMTLQPVLSPMLWNAIGTGKRADKHGILGFTTVDEATGSVRPFGTMDRKVKAVWNILNQAGKVPHVVNWFCGHPAEPLRGSDITELVIRQVMKDKNVDHRPELPKDSVYPEDLREVVAACRVWPQDIDAQTISLFVPNYMEVDQEKDRRLEMIASQLASCLTTHAITTWLMANRDWDFIGAYFGEIDHFGHGFMKYHPPKQSHIPEKDFALYKNVVNGAYRLHDLLLGRYLQLIDDETTIIVCSDHGFHPDHLRPRSIPRTPAGPAEEHRPVGMIAMAGPNIKKDELVHGATLLDITPTILAALDLPVGQDMEGRVLTEAFETSPEPKTIPSWEDVDGEDGMLDRSTRMTAKESENLIQQFVDLGYIDPPEGNREKDNAVTLGESTWNLSRVYLSTGRYAKALPLLEEVYTLFPLRFDIGLRLAECLCSMGLAEEGKEVAENLAEAYPNRPWAWMIRGLAELSLRNREAALDLFKQVEQADPSMTQVHLRLGRTYLGMRTYPEARAAFEKGLEKDPENVALLQGLAGCAFAEKDYERAANLSLDALGLEFALPMSHLRLGMCLARLGNFDAAIQALETAVRYAPNLAPAHRLLRVLYHRHHQPEKIPAVDEALARIRQQRKTHRERLAAIRKDLHERKRRQAAKQLQEAEDLTALIMEEASKPKPAYHEPPKPGSVKPGSSGKTFVIVSGLPRSGTSLMMQMLQAGGLDPMTDGERAADVDNPEGYLEWEAVKKLGRQPHLIEQAEGKAVKVISMLLGKLPPVHRYKVIFMDRPVEEVAASQAKMIDRRGGRKPAGSEEQSRTFLHKHREAVLANLDKVPHMEVLTVSYPDLVAEPGRLVPDLVAFLGEDRLPTPEAMAGVVKTDLYRNVAS